VNNVKFSRLIKRIKDFTVFFTCVSLIVGVVFTISNMRASQKQTRLAGLVQAKDVFDKEDAIGKDIDDFLKKSDPNTNALWDKYKNGRSMYYSHELEQFYRICHHYEKVGALVKRDYVDFKLYFDLVSFPDDFWKRTELLRAKIKGNWKGEKDSLPDFLANFEELRNRYVQERTNQKWMFWK
jgi:hypothetical protein